MYKQLFGFIAATIKFVLTLALYLVVGILIGIVLGSALGFAVGHMDTTVVAQKGFFPTLPLWKYDTLWGTGIGALIGFGIAPYIMLWRRFSRFMDREAATSVVVASSRHDNELSQ